LAAGSPSVAEVEALSHALETERLAEIAYRQVLATNVLKTSVRSQLGVLLAQDQEHVARLEEVLTRLGASLPQGPTGVAAAQAMLAKHGVHRSLSALPTQHDCLRILIDVESLTEGAYFKAIPALADPTLLQLSVAIMGSDAQHWTVLSRIQHHGDPLKAVPYPFVEGSP
jgi:hypothetical protein